MTRARRTAVGLALGGLAVACGACSPPPEPTVMETPAIVWKDGIEPSSLLEDHELVQVARRAEVGRSMAWNSGDFTITQLTDNVGVSLITSAARTYGEQREMPWADPGPDVWEPLEIVKESAGGGVIAVCRPRRGEAWFISEKDATFGEVEPEGSVDWITIAREGGRLKLVKYDSSPDFADCDASGVPIGLFDPLPEVPTEPVYEPVRPPSFEEQ